jgi:hypothetical protein
MAPPEGEVVKASRPTPGIPAQPCTQRVTVDYTPSVGMGQGVGELQAISLDLLKRKARRGDLLAKRAAFDVFHCDIRLSVGFAYFVDRTDVGMIQR